MTLNPSAILAHSFAPIAQSYVQRDAILYALGIGLGADPLDAADLRFLLETELAVLPTMAVTLGSPGMWVRAPEFGIDFAKLVHSAQAARFFTPLLPTGSIVATARVASLTDRGEGKGAMLVLERSICDAASSECYCTLEQTLLLRGDGGFGGPPAPRGVSTTVPDRAPDARIVFPVSRRAALIYRLSGDWNPLHADPAAARQGGFERPILHGLASYGIAGWVIMRDSHPARLTSLSMRFSGVVYPGDDLEFSIWRQSGKVFFEAHSNGRKVLDQGVAELG